MGEFEWGWLRLIAKFSRLLNILVFLYEASADSLSHALYLVFIIKYEVKYIIKYFCGNLINRFWNFFDDLQTSYCSNFAANAFYVTTLASATSKGSVCLTKLSLILTMHHFLHPDLYSPQVLSFFTAVMGHMPDHRSRVALKASIMSSGRRWSFPSSLTLRSVSVVEMLALLPR